MMKVALSNLLPVTRKTSQAEKKIITTRQCQAASAKEDCDDLPENATIQIHAPTYAKGWV